MKTAEELSQEVLDLTKILILAAEASNIYEFQSTLQLRNETMKLIEASVLNSGDTGIIQENLAAARQLNEQLLAVFCQERQLLLDKKSGIIKGAQMKSAYSRNK